MAVRAEPSGAPGLEISVIDDYRYYRPVARTAKLRAQERVSVMRLPMFMAMAVVAVGAACPAFSHHSVANFDFKKSGTVTGTVTYFSFTNPHSFIDMQVQDEAGDEHAYKIFTVARVVMMRTGWALEDLKPGDKVTITGSPDRKNPQYMYLNRIVFASGKVWDRDPALQK